MAKTPRDHPDPRSVIEGAKASSKATRFLYAGYTVLAMAAVILSWNRAPGALLGVAAIFIALATIVSLLTFGLTKPQVLPALVSLWAVLAISVLVALLFFSSLFFGFLERGSVIVARM